MPYARASEGFLRETTIGGVLDLSGGSIKTGPFGTKLAASEYSSDGVPVISVGEVGYGAISVTHRTKRVGPDVTDRMPEYLLAAGDIVFGRKGAVDRSAWVKHSEAGYFLGSDGIRLRFGAGVDSRFMAFQFQSARVRNWLLQHAIGTTLASLNEPTLKALPVRLPPIEEQRGIAATLGALDDKIESNRHVQTLALDLAEALYRHACEAGSATVPMKNVGKWLSGGTPSTSHVAYWGGDLPWISAASLKSFYVDESNRNLTEAGAAAATNIVPAGALLMVVRGMSLKTEFRFGLAQREVSFGQDCKAIIPSINGSVLAIAMRSMGESILELVDEAGHGTGRLQTDLLEQVGIEVPDDPAFADTADCLLARGAAASSEMKTLVTLRDLLLPELLSGRIRVPEAREAIA